MSEISDTMDAMSGPPVSRPGDAPSDHRNPFPGLRPFLEKEQHLFFGRENQVDAMVDKLAATHFLAVVGTSGSGKSSLVNCGLRPALSRGLMARAGTSWRMVQFRPGNNPIAALAGALASKDLLFPALEDEHVTLEEIVETNLRMSRRGLIDIFEQAAPGEGVNLLVVVDQFEELFRYRREPIAGQEADRYAGEQATAFVNLLLEVRECAAERIFVVLTMRSDFLGDCTRFPGLAEAINAGQFLVPRLTRDERRAAIERPVAVGGATMSPVLLTRLVNDVGDDPDQLSMLQHALNRTWARWERDGATGPLALEHYEAIGTMAHALDQHAERAWAELGGERSQLICERMFKALTDKTDHRGLRRPTTFAVLCALADATAEELAAVIEVFRKPSRSFLMPPHDEKLMRDSTIDISHESLMRVWDRLKKWTDEEAASARTYRRLAEAAQEYGKNAIDLWRDPQLQSTLDWRDRNRPNQTWAARYHPDFAAAMEFLDDSRIKRESDRARERQRAQQELDAAREKAEIAREKAESQARNARRMTWAAAFCGALALLSIALFAFAFHAYRQAEASKTEAQIAQTRALINAAARSDPTAKILLALEALPDGKERADWPVVFAAEDMLAEGIRQLRERAVLTGDSADVLAVAVNADGGRIVTGSSDKIARVWDGESGAELLRLEKHTGAVQAVAITPDGHRIVTGADNVTRIWDANSGAELFRLENNAGSNVMAVAVTPDGRRVVSGSDDNSAQIWDGETGALMFRLDGHTKPVSAVAITPSGSHVVTGSDDKSARIWDVHSGSLLFQLEGHTGAVTAVAVSADGRRVITGSADKSVRVWDNGVILKAFPPRGPHDTILSVAATAGGVRIITGLDSYAARISDDYAAKVWTATMASNRPDLQGASVELKGHAGTVRLVAATANGSRLVTASDDRTLRVWNSGGLRQEQISFKTQQDLQSVVERAKALVPRCLTVFERKANLVAPPPPAWCIEMRKYPYDTRLWKDWYAGKPPPVDTDISNAYGDFADAALRGGAFQMAEHAAKLGMTFDPGQTWIMINQASAHMFMNRIDEARAEYLSHRGEAIDNGRRWNETIADEFKSFREKGRRDSLMDEIEKELSARPDKPGK